MKLFCVSCSRGYIIQTLIKHNYREIFPTEANDHTISVILLVYFFVR